MTFHIFIFAIFVDI